MTKLYKFHLTLIQLSKKKKFFLKSPLDWDETWKISTQSQIFFFFLGSCEQIKMRFGGSILPIYHRRVTASTILVDETFGKRPAAEIQSVTLFCWRFHL